MLHFTNISDAKPSVGPADLRTTGVPQQIGVVRFENVHELLSDIRNGLSSTTQDGRDMRKFFAEIILSKVLDARSQSFVDIDDYLVRFFQDSNHYPEVVMQYMDPLTVPTGSFCMESNLPPRERQHTIILSYQLCAVVNADPTNLFAKLLLVATFYHGLADLVQGYLARIFNIANHKMLKSSGFEVESAIFGGILCPRFADSAPPNFERLEGLYMSRPVDSRDPNISPFDSIKTTISEPPYC